ncbi:MULTISPECIES: hypothetical protein [unclassified Micromonospora]|uniref:hypothetical protein n=1 Tax=unclassified Micromonospora TaxID=2617518 RepID=UPI0033BF40EA
MLRPNDQPVPYLTEFGGGVNPDVEAGEWRNLDVSSAIDAARGVGDKPEYLQWAVQDPYCKTAGRHSAAARRSFTRALRMLKVKPTEVVTDAAPVYPGVLDEPGAFGVAPRRA